jgi:ribonuclease G
VSEEILINITPRETRVALVENGVLQEVHIERSRSRGIVGNIYKGKVVRVLPGMQAAFVDIGGERTAFLHASDVSRGSGANGANDAPGPAEPIHTLLQDGQELVVQVLKDPIGTKGARLTTQISLPARYVVYLPQGNCLGVSQKIENPAERERLRASVARLIGEEAGGQGGFILRTMAESASDEDLRLEVRFLCRLWEQTREHIAALPAPARVYEDLPLSLRAMRDLVRGSVEKLRIDSRESYEKAVQFATDLIPELLPRLEHYPGERPLFDLYSVEDEIKRALEKKVSLKSGGYLVFDQTEAMTTVDVNTGGYIGKHNLEETLFKTNLEAAQAIARQLRLRNIGGIVILDFIDMADPEHRRQVMRALERALARDRVKTFITDMSSLGLVEVTRKRTRESMEQILCEPCPVCQGRGRVKTAQTVCYEIFREILREVRQFEAGEYVVLASQRVVDLMLDEEAGSLADLQEFIKKPIRVRAESAYQQEDYDIVLT